MANKRTRPESLGTTQRLPSGRWRAFYRIDGRRFGAPHTFETKTAGFVSFMVDLPGPDCLEAGSLDRTVAADLGIRTGVERICVPRRPASIEIDSPGRSGL